MKTYVVVLSESGEETICARYKTLRQAKAHLRSVRYTPCYRRTLDRLDITPDGMIGVGYCDGNEFTYTITTEISERV